MRNSATLTAVAFICVAFFALSAAAFGEAVGSEDAGHKGYLEIDCNLSNVDLYLCPKENFTRKTVRVFFGLIKSKKTVCSEDELFIGTTPIAPVPVPAGMYVILIPADFGWENEGVPEITVRSGKKTYFLLKLFSKRATRHEDDLGGGGGGGGGGAAGR